MKSKDLFYCESAINDLPTYMKQWINKHINKIPIKVPVRRNCMTGSGINRGCHYNSRALKRVYGGGVLTGFMIENVIGIYSLTSHSVWVIPEGKAVDVTANNYSSTNNYSVFIPIYSCDALKRLNTIIIPNDYKKFGITVDCHDHMANSIIAKNANLKLTQDGCIEVPSSAFNSNLMEFPAQNEIPDLTLKLKAFFSIKSKYTNKSFEEIFDERVLRSY
jgi:hypothetical protein